MLRAHVRDGAYDYYGSPFFRIDEFFRAGDKGNAFHRVRDNVPEMSNDEVRQTMAEIQRPILDDGSVDVSEQHLRAHDRHVWKENEGKWCLTKKTFAGNVTHRFVTREYDLEKEQFVATEGLIESDEPYARHCASTDVLVELGTYCKGQVIA